MECKDRVAIVTGAAGKGMGRSIALTLAREGAKVVVNYRLSAKEVGEIVSHIQQQGVQALAVGADVFKLEECEALVEKATQQFGQVDICIIGPGADWHAKPIDKLNVKGALRRYVSRNCTNLSSNAASSPEFDDFYLTKIFPREGRVRTSDEMIATIAEAAT